MMGKVLQRIQQKVVDVIFSVSRAERLERAMVFTTGVVCMAAIAIMLYGVNLFALAFQMSLPGVVVLYQLGCAVVGTYIAQSYLAVHPVSAGYSGAQTHARAQWLAAMVDDEEYTMLCGMQYFAVAVVSLMAAIVVPVRALIGAVVCCIIVRAITKQYAPWVTGVQLRDNMASQMRYMREVLRA